MEARLLLAADLSGFVFDSVGLGRIDNSQSIDSYFVTFDDAHDATALAQATGARSATPSDFVANGYTLEFDSGLTVQQAVNTFSAMAGFNYLHPQVARQFVTRATPDDPLYNDQWHLNNTGQGGGTAGADANIESVWDNYTGQGVIIGIVDDGLEVTHEDLAPNVRTDIDFDWNDNDQDPSPGQFDSHGTAVGGVASARGNNGTGVSGAAWDAELVGLRLIAGPVTDQDEAAALTHRSDIIDIYNNSWGPGDFGSLGSIGPQALAALEQAATTGRDGLGSIHTWAGGNGGDITTDNVNYDPYANSRFTIAVGALTNTGVRSSYSDPGAALVVTAYSNGGSLGITTTDQTGENGYSANNYTADFGGTSSATPLVTGVIALMLEANPNLTYRDVTDILAHTSERVDANNSDWVQNGAGIWVNHEYGFGGIDATAAVNAAVDHVSLAPEQTFTTGTQTINEAIPDSGGGPLTQTVTVSEADAISLEYVEVVFNSEHQSIGDLEIVLTSPDGTRSILAETRTTETASAYADWVFSSTRHWDESSEGEWSLTVTDGTSGSTGTLNSFSINFYGTPIDVLPPVAPSVTAPTGSITDATPTVEWTPVTNGNAYNINVVDATGNVIFTQQGITETSYEIPTLAEGSYQVQVQAVNVEDEVSPFSPFASFTIDIPTPTAPAIIAPVGTTLDLTPLAEWTEVDFAVTYNLQVTDSENQTVVNQSGITETSFQLPELTQDTYHIQVQAVNGVGETSVFSAVTSFMIDIPVPPKPTVLSPLAEVSDNAQPQFQWTTENAATSRLWVAQLREGTGTAQVPAVYDRIIYVTNHTQGTYTWFNQLRQEGRHAVWVQNFNVIGERGPWSDPVFFTLDVPAPATPVLTSINSTDNLRPTIEWNAQEYGHSHELWVNNLTSGEARVIHERTITGTNSFTPAENLTQGRYRAWVRASNSVGEKSGWSEAITFDVDILTPGRPTVTGPVTLNEQGSTRNETTTAKPTFTWSPVVSASTYELWVNHVDSRTSRIIHERSLTTSEFTSATDLPEGGYRAWVRAFNFAGDAGPWSEAYLFTLDIPVPSAPTITGPATNAVGSVIDPTPTITWTTSTGDVRSYDLQVEEVSGGQLVIDVQGILTTDYTPSQDLNDATYRVRVRGVNSADEAGTWSEWHDLIVDVPKSTTPVAFSPAGTITQSNVDFEWRHTNGNVRYEIFVRDLLNQESIVLRMTTLELNLASDNAVYRAEDFEDGTYRWWVRAFNSQGTASSWSNAQTFKVDTLQANLEQENKLLPEQLLTTAVSPISTDAPTVPETTQHPSNVTDKTADEVERNPSSTAATPVNRRSKSQEIATVMAELANPESHVLMFENKSPS